MKVLEQNHRVKSFGVQDRRYSTLKTSSKAFRMLSDTLYSDAVEAILRELGTNAVDAHVDAGNSEPFEIHLPTVLEPYFSIRDYGTGISQEKFEQVYLIFFESDKTDSNDFVGSIGIGAKSPFAYTQSYNITSYVNGAKYCYTYFKNEDDIPELDTLSETDTDEPNGLEVTFAVKPIDFSKFKERAEKVYRWFSLRPKSNIELYYEDVDYSVKGKDYGLYYHYEGKIKAIMGNIAYPVDKSQFTKKTHKQLLEHCGIDIWFPIGVIDFTPSRESLKYNKRTLSALEQKFDEILLSYKVDLQEKTDKARNLFEARKIYVQYSNVLGNIAAGLNITFNGQPLGKRIFVCKEHKFRTLERNRNGNYALRQITDLCLQKNTTIYFMDDKTRVRDRLLHLTKTKDIYLVEDCEEHRKLVEEVGVNFDSLPKVSEFPKPSPLPQKKRGVVTKGWLYRANISRHYRSNYIHWYEHEFAFKDGGVYVNLFCYNGSYNYQRYIDILTCLKDEMEIIGLRPAFHKKAIESDDWICLKDYTNYCLKDVIPQIKSDYIEWLGLKEISFFVEQLELLKEEKLPLELQALLMEQKRLENLDTRFNKLITLLTIEELGMDESAKNSAIYKYKHLTEKYKLLELVGWNDLAENKSQMVDYLNLVGAKK